MKLGDIEQDYGYEIALEAIRDPGAAQFYRQVELLSTHQIKWR